MRSKQAGRRSLKDLPAGRLRPHPQKSSSFLAHFQCILCCFRVFFVRQSACYAIRRWVVAVCRPRDGVSGCRSGRGEPTAPESCFSGSCFPKLVHEFDFTGRKKRREAVGGGSQRVRKGRQGWCRPTATDMPSAHGRGQCGAERAVRGRRRAHKAQGFEARGAQAFGAPLFRGG